MKKYLFFLCMATLYCTMTFAQSNFGKYSMQHSTSESELQQYVGQHVKVFEYSPANGIDDSYDAYRFDDMGGITDAIYTIEKIKVGKFIFIDLVSDSGKKVKAKVNLNHEKNYKGMKTCESFFLIDKFEADKNTIIGKAINNSEGQPVAKVIDFKMLGSYNKFPTPHIVIKSDFDGSIISCTEEEAKVACSYYGKTLTHPKVKHQYKVVGISYPKPKEAYNPKYALYNLQNPENPDKKEVCEVNNPEIDAFEHDLEGHYVSVLSKVEKPANPAIRYGKTTTVEDKDKNISKYSYVDNVIDILIFGGSKQFDFILRNVSDNSIKVVWNEAVFVDYDGTTSKVMHVGTKYSQREADQPASTIIKGAKIEDLAAPNCNVRYSDILKEWVTDSMYPSKPALEPGQLRLMLPIQIKDVVNEYIFVFDVNYVYDHPERLNL
ncbi:hypothetical protein SAMN04488494_0593 [Xylanibacter ruminicola]|uniref:Uncharacterized protein n=1 Tax=Xylanibacter ruminicola TaxID=839 RepID=A0A1M7D126_XYLRU|nr:hypothetical protein [Xylanibacter ruminicola]SHL73221.1 hypothetical protein SAMN04488494_0593 [Xylanibacter ruminicola]